MAFGELISVIVPVYNVRRYLRQCLESLASQDYPSFEIVLVDDGSTDGSGRICDEYATRNKRFSVVHQSNAGLSAARNVGLAHAHGRYVSFVDSDDWVAENYLSMLMTAVERSGMPCASLAHLKPFRDGFGCRLHMESGGASSARIEPERINVMDETTMQKALLRQQVNCGAQARLCRRDVLLAVAPNGEVFPKGLLYEDLATVYRIIHEAHGSALIYESLYAYRHRCTGIMGNRGAFHDEKVASAVHVSRALYVNMTRWYPSLAKESASRCLSLLCTVYSSLDVMERDNRETVWREIQQYCGLTRDDVGARLKDRAAACCAMGGERVFAMLCRLYRGYSRWTGC